MTAARAAAHLVPVVCSQCRQATLEPLGDNLPNDLAQQLTPTERRLFTVLWATPEPLRARELVPLVWGTDYLDNSGIWTATVSLSRLKVAAVERQGGKA